MASKKVALITGGNKGIGLEIARQLGQQGVTVVIGARDAAKGQAAADKLKSEGFDTHSVKLEVTNPTDVAALPGFFKKQFGGLDILINNAGVMLDKGEAPTAETFRQTYETNVIAPYLVTEALIPLLTASPAGRVVNHSSVLGSIGTLRNVEEMRDSMPYPAYNSSKAALNMLTVLHANRLRNTAVKVNAAHPGWVKTDMGGDQAPMEITDGAKTAVSLALLPENGPTGAFFHLEQEMPW